MKRGPDLLLWDVADSLEAIRTFTTGKTLDDYLRDRLLRLGTERLPTIVGEALARLAQTAPEVAALVPDQRAITGLRNILVHGYAGVDHAAIWRIVTEDAPALAARVDEIRRARGE